MDRDKIRLRAKRAFAGEKVHRITEVTEKSLLYRVHGVGNIMIKRDKLGRIYVPKEVPSGNAE